MNYTAATVRLEGPGRLRGGKCGPSRGVLHWRREQAFIFPNETLNMSIPCSPGYAPCMQTSDKHTHAHAEHAPGVSRYALSCRQAAGYFELSLVLFRRADTCARVHACTHVHPAPQC